MEIFNIIQANSKVIVAAILGWFGKIFTDSCIEKLKLNNEKVKHISKAQFDYEFKIYQELSEASFQLIYDTSVLFPLIDSIPIDEEQKNNLFRERYTNVNTSLVDFQNSVQKYAPFIPQDLYDIFWNFKKSASDIFIGYETYVIEDIKRGNYPEKILTPKIYTEYREKTQGLSEEHSSLIKNL
jgi:hypothetical protein